jgi:WD40 repeat protein
VNSVAVIRRPDRLLAACASGEPIIRLWDVTSGKVVGSPLVGHDGPVNAVVLGEIEGHPVLFSGGADGTVRIWDVTSHELIGNPLVGHDGPVNAVAFGEVEGQPMLFSAGADRTVFGWDRSNSLEKRPDLVAEHR